jgi:hypothetical protein
LSKYNSITLDVNILQTRSLFKYVCTSLLVPGDPGRLGTHIYVITVESPEPVGARHASCTQLLWKPHDPSTKDTPIYLFTFETSRPVVGKTQFMSLLLWKPRDPGRQGTPISLVPAETLQVGRQGTHIYVLTVET